MAIRLLTSEHDLQAYGRWIQSHAQNALWQSLAWGDYQKALGRDVRIYGVIDGEAITGGALVVIDRTTGGLCTWDIPRGPIGQHGNELLDAITADAKAAGALALFASPLLPLSLSGSLPSPRHEQPDATRILDLTLDDNALLAQMKPKGRYNIGVAQRYALEVRESHDVDAFYALLQKTSERDAFGIGSKSRYKAFLERVPGAFLLLCYHTSFSDTEPIAGFLGVIHGSTGIYYYGASSYEHRQLMAPYLLQWEAIRRCRAAGCTSYDLLGVAPPDAGDSHPWAGVSTFKEKFGGTVVTYPHEQQLILRPWLWRALQVKRRLWR